MRPLAHPIAPVVGAALAALAYLLIQPATADMAAHAFRAWLFDTEGMTVWNAQWYGGHHVLGYSMLFAPLAAWPGPAWVGALGAVAATAAFVPLAREAAPSPGAATAATWLFAAGVLSNVVIGRMPFTLGIALAVAAWLCAARPTVAWRALAAVLALACVLASPVAGAFLALAAAARAAGSGREALGLAATLVLPVAVGGATMAVLFPEGGDDRFVATAFWPMLAVSVVAAALLAPDRRALRAGVILYLVVLVARVRDPERRSARTRCACRCCSGRRCCCWPRAPAPRASRSPPCWSRSCTCSGCRPCAPWPRRTATRRPRRRSSPTRARSWTASCGRASASRWRSRTTTGRPPTSRPACRWRAAGSASSTRRPTRSSTTAGR